MALTITGTEKELRAFFEEKDSTVNKLKNLLLEVEEIKAEVKRITPILKGSEV